VIGNVAGSDRINVTEWLLAKPRAIGDLGMLIPFARECAATTNPGKADSEATDTCKQIYEPELRS
jgi:hypothetical protein